MAKSKVLLYAGFVYMLVLVLGGISYAAKDDVVITNTIGDVYLRSGTTLSAIIGASGLGSISHLAIQPDGDVVLYSADNTVWLRRAADLAAVASSSGFGAINNLAIQPDGA